MQGKEYYLQRKYFMDIHFSIHKCKQTTDFHGKSIFDSTNDSFVVLEFSPGSTEGVKAIVFPNMSEGGWEVCIHSS